MYTSPRAVVWRTLLRSRVRHCESATQIWNRRHYAADGQIPVRKVVHAPAVRNHQGGSGARPLHIDRPVVIETDSCGVSIRHSEDKKAYFEHLAIRDMCQCEMCVNPSTRQRRFSFADIPLDIKGHYRHLGPHKLEARWTNDVQGFGPDHSSVFWLDDLLFEGNRQDRGWNRLYFYGRNPWDKERLQSGLLGINTPFSKFIEDDKERNRAAAMLLRWGLIFIKEVPADSTLR